MDYEKLHKNTLAALPQRVSEGKMTEEVARSICADFVKESEDDIMRKMAIKAVCSPEAQSCIKSWRINPSDVITWLEKQGEHANFRNKIQIGDEVTRNEDGVLVNLSQFERVAKERVRKGEQNSAWGEEDMGMMVLVAKILDNHKSDTDFVLYNTPYEDVVSWLKSLKNMAQPQSKQEWSWSEKDEAHAK